MGVSYTVAHFKAETCREIWIILCISDSNQAVLTVRDVTVQPSTTALLIMLISWCAEDCILALGSPLLYGVYRACVYDYTRKFFKNTPLFVCSILF